MAITRSISCLVSLVFLTGVFSGAGCGDEDKEKRTICPVSDSCPESGSTRYTYKELSQMWWKWAIKNPASKSPILDTDGASCAEQQPSGTIWFLAGTGGDPAKRSCKVPAGRGLFFPVLAGLCTACKKDEDCEARGYSTTTCPEDPQDDQTLLGCLKDQGFPDAAVEMAVTVDGNPVDKLKESFRVEGGLFEVTGPTDPNELLFACTAGTRKAAGDGYYVFVEPLSAGDHTVNIKGKEKSGYTVDVEYKLSVE